jgi:hypothetical protein
LRRISVPEGGPSIYITILDGEPFRRNFPCNCTQSLSVAWALPQKQLPLRNFSKVKESPHVMYGAN